MAPVWVGRFAQDAGIVVAFRQYESDFRIAQQMNLVHRAPWRHMVDTTNEREYRHTDISERDRPAFHFVAARRQEIFVEQTPQIAGVPALGHASTVRVPCH